MELLPLLFFCLLTRFGTFADDNGPALITMVIKEGNDAILPCSHNTNEDIIQKLFDWKKDGRQEVFMYDAGLHYNNGRSGQDEQFKERVFHFPEELRFGNASIIIRDTRVADSGNYTCDFPHLQLSRQSRISLLVGASPKPYVTSLKETSGWTLLQCEVRGASPQPKVEWQDSSGNTLPSKGPQVTRSGFSYNIILQSNVTKTGVYRCIATQGEIFHQIYTETDVYVPDGSLQPIFTIVKQTKHWAVLQCEVQGASPKLHLHWKDSSGNILSTEKPMVIERAGSFNVILQVNVTRTDFYHCVAKQDEVNNTIHTKSHIYIAGGKNTGKSSTVIVALCLALLVTIK